MAGRINLSAAWILWEHGSPALTKIVATGDTVEFSNGYCGAESGYVAVSAASPAISHPELEVQKKQSSHGSAAILRPRRTTFRNPEAFSNGASRLFAAPFLLAAASRRWRKPRR